MRRSTVSRRGGRLATKRTSQARAKRSSRSAGGFKWAKTAEVVAAAQALEAAGELRLAERLRGEARAERLFHERYAAREERVQKPEEHYFLKVAALLLELAQEGRSQGFPFASDRPLEILEAPSVRDYLGILVGARRTHYYVRLEDHKRLCALLDQIGKCLSGKPKAGSSSYSDLVWDWHRHEEDKALHKGLARAHKETPRRLTGEEEILGNLRDRAFELKPPPFLVRGLPTGELERQAESFTNGYLPGLARELSGYRKDSRRSGLPLRLRALRLARDSLPPERRYGPPSQWGKPAPDLDEHDRLLAEFNRIQKRFSPQRNPRT
jgi:hypothetical protein